MTREERDYAKSRIEYLLKISTEYLSVGILALDAAMTHAIIKTTYRLRHGAVKQRRVTMIVIDMDMPECWDDCRFNNGCECCLIDAVCTDETAGENGELPSFCPIKCDIEDIKHDIENQLFVGRLINHYEFDEGLKWCLEIIDKHIKEISDADTHIDA